MEGKKVLITTITVNTREIGNIRTEPLWNNHTISYKGQPLYFKTWEWSGISYVQDLWTNGTVLSQEPIGDITGNYPGFTFEHNAIINAVEQLWAKPNA